MNDYMADKRSGVTKSLYSSLTSKGQALVEFVLVFVLLLVVSWIPAEFGLAFYTSQVAQNAVREGARIAAADTNPAASAGWCDIPACYSGANILKETSLRLPAALMSNIRVTLTVDAPSDTNCNEMVTVSARGQFHFFFYQILRLIGVTVSDAKQINTSAKMRWEHQPACNPF
jgi:TadE-like protein